MKAPDKVYVYCDYEGRPDKVDIYKLGNQSVAYIRKDALLEWLNGKVYEHNEDRFDDGFNAALGQVIDKISSL